MQYNMPLAAVVVLAIGLIVWFAYSLEKKRPEWTFLLRKALHVLVIFLAAVASWILPSNLVVIVSILASCVVFLAIKANRFSEVASNGKLRKPWGMLYFCIIYTLLNALVIVASDVTSDLLKMMRLSTVYAFLVLAFADGMAGFLGRMVSANHRLRFNHWNRVKLGNDEKSWIGFVIFSATTLILSVLFLHFWGLSVSGKWVELIVFSVLLGVVEMISSGGSDNLFVSLVAWIFAMVLSSGLYFHGYVELFYQSDIWLLCYLLISGFTAIVLVKKGWMKASGAAMAWLLAFVVQIMALWSILPLVVFLAAATVVGKFRKKEISNRGDEKSDKPRDHWQVLANGGLFLFFALLSYLNEFEFFSSVGQLMGLDGIAIESHEFGRAFFFLALLSLSVSSADTMSSELGQWLGGTPRNILTWKSTQKGVSGGVTVAGFVGAFLGASMIAVFIFFYEPFDTAMVFNLSRIQGFWILVIFGLFGTLIDSLLGEIFQAKFKNTQGEWSDQPWPGQMKSCPEKGFSVISNDVVNALTGIVSLILASVFFSLIDYIKQLY